METLEYIWRECASMRRQFGTTVAGMTDDLLNAPAPGVANTIGATLVHLVSSEEYFTQKLLQTRPTLWDSQGWNAAVGMNISSDGDLWAEAGRVSLKLAPILQYQEAVCAQTEAYLKTLQPQDLDRTIDLFGRQVPVAEAIILMVSHAVGHLGEIAALKGIQGVKGLPY